MRARSFPFPRRIAIDPDLAAFEELLLPDRNARFERLDPEPAGLERLLTVRGGDRDHHRGLAESEPTAPVHHRDPAGPEAGREVLADGRHLPLGHLHVRLILEG